MLLQAGLVRSAECGLSASGKARQTAMGIRPSEGPLMIPSLATALNCTGHCSKCAALAELFTAVLKLSAPRFIGVRGSAIPDGPGREIAQVRAVVATRTSHHRGVARPPCGPMTTY